MDGHTALGNGGGDDFGCVVGARDERFRTKMGAIVSPVKRCSLLYSHLDCEKVLAVPGGDLVDIAAPNAVPQRQREVIAAAVEAGVHVGRRIHGHAQGDDVFLVADWPIDRIKTQAVGRTQKGVKTTEDTGIPAPYVEEIFDKRTRERVKSIAAILFKKSHGAKQRHIPKSLVQARVQGKQKHVVVTRAHVRDRSSRAAATAAEGVGQSIAGVALCIQPRWSDTISHNRAVAGDRSALKKRRNG